MQCDAGEWMPAGDKWQWMVCMRGRGGGGGGETLGNMCAARSSSSSYAAARGMPEESYIITVMQVHAWSSSRSGCGKVVAQMEGVRRCTCGGTAVLLVRW
jgi:hypothetical protein